MGLKTTLRCVIAALLLLSLALCGCGRSEVTTVVLTTAPEETVTTAPKETILTEPAETEAVPTAEPTSPPTEATEEPFTEPGKAVDYVLNINSMKFHEPTCSSVKQIKDTNRKDYTGTREEVIRQGYSPCGRCKP